MSSAVHGQSTDVGASPVPATFPRVKSVVVLPNLSYPVRPSNYVSGRPGASDTLIIRKTTDCRRDESFMYSSGTADLVNVSSGAGGGVLGSLQSDGLRWIKTFFSKNASKALKKIKIYRAKLRRHWHFL